MVLPARNGSPVGAVLNFSGGPGQGAVAAARAMPVALGDLLEDHDVILFDQRGTGASNGLFCTPPSDPVGWFRGGIFDAPTLRECKARLSTRADLGAYRTAPAVDDARDVLDALGYRKVHVRGASYGTRMAIALASAYPDRVASLTLSGVVPPDDRPAHSFARSFRGSMDRVFADCASTPECASANPDPRAALDTLLARSDRGAEARIAVGGREVVVPVNRLTLLYAIRGMLYGADAWKLPGWIADAARSGDLSVFAQAYADRMAGVWSGLAIGMQLSTNCAEDVVAPSAPVPQPPPLSDLLLDEYRKACAVWDVPSAGRSALAPSVPLRIPTLLFSGARDPVTPAEGAERLRAFFPRSHHVIFPRGGHGYTGVDPSCAARITAAFMRNPQPDRVQGACAGETDAHRTTSSRGSPSARDGASHLFGLEPWPSLLMVRA